MGEFWLEQGSAVWAGDKLEAVAEDGAREGNGGRAGELAG